MSAEIDITHVARLARLALSEDDLEFYRDQLAVIVEHAAKVQELEGEPEIESSHALELTGVYREDVVTESLDRDEVLAMAPQSKDGYFVVPPALES